MTPGTVPTSARGGRSVLRSAAAVEAAALRTHALGASQPLAALTALGNPLARLLDGPLDLAVLDRVLGLPTETAVRRSTGECVPAGRIARTASARAGRPGPATASAAAARGPGGLGAAVSRGIGTTAQTAASALQRPANAGAAAPTSVSPSARRGSSINRAGAAPRSGAKPTSATPPVESRTIPRGAPPLDLARVRAASSTGALRSAARSTQHVTPATPPAPAPDDGRDLARSALAELPAATTPASPSGPLTTGALHGTSPATGRVGAAYPDGGRGSAQPAREFSGGSLAEVVARWQDDEPRPHASGEADAGGPGPGAATSTRTSPLSSTSFDRERPLQLGDEYRIESALAEILRREVERHGLEGGR